MSFGKMSTRISIAREETSKDADGFSETIDVVLAKNIMAYKENRHGTEKWANRAAFSTASALFRFRKIYGLMVDATMFILCDDGRYKILSVEPDVRSRGMYIEVLADIVRPSKR